jgi:hypothetical protein
MALSFHTGYIFCICKSIEDLLIGTKSTLYYSHRPRDTKIE